MSRNKISAGLAIVIFLALSLSAEPLVFPPYLHTYGIRKATPSHLMMFFGPRTFFNDPQGLAATRLDSWDDPLKSGDDDEVVVYGVNAGRGEIIYNTSMYTLGLFGSRGSGTNQLLEPRGIAGNRAGYVFVADSGNNRVVKLFNPKSKLIWRGAFNGRSDKDRGLSGPSRIGIDEQVNVYVTDPGNRRIVVFDSSGKVLRLLYGNPPAAVFVDGPTALAVADGRARYSYYSGERVIFCADKNGTRLWKLSLDGKTVLCKDMPAGYSASYGAIDYFHHFWLTDTRQHCLLKFDHDLNFLATFGSHGTGDNQFVEPRGITMYKRFGQAFVAEKKGAQYFWVGTSGHDIALAKIDSTRYDLKLRTTEFSLVSLFSAIKKDTVFYFKKRWVACGRQHVTFESATELRGKGLTVRFEPTYSSLTYSSWEYPVAAPVKK